MISANGNQVYGLIRAAPNTNMQSGCTIPQSVQVLKDPGISAIGQPTNPVFAKLEQMHTDLVMADHDTAERLDRIEELVQNIAELLLKLTERGSATAAHQAHTLEAAGATPAPATSIGHAIMHAIREASR